MGAARIIPANPKGIFLPCQMRWIKDNSRLKGAEKARQIGWSWTSSYATVERTGRAGAKNDQWISSRDEIQAQLFLSDAKVFSKVLKIVAGEVGERIIDDKGATAKVLPFANGRCIYSMSSNPDAQAGKRGGRVLDEFALHKDQRKLWSIAYPGITWGGSLEFFSTHRGSKSFFNQLIQEVREGGNPKKISLHRITLEDALSEGLLYKLQERLPPDDPIQDMDEAAYFDFIKSGCADEESFLQEYMCVPGDDDAAFLEYDLIGECEYPKDTPWELDYETALAEHRGREFYAGLDIGRTQDLTVLWILERVGGVFFTRKIITLKKMSKPDQEKVLWPWLPLMRRTCFDYTGLGIGWGDDALAKFGPARVELVKFSGPVKEALAYPIRGRMEDKRLWIPYDPVVRADLRAVTKVVTATNNIRFTAERTPNGHADRFWALGLAIEAGSSPVAEMPDVHSRRPLGHRAMSGYSGVTTTRELMRGYS
jgi:phage FluMu gp28-like protein